MEPGADSAPDACHFSEPPVEKVQIMGRLIHEHAAPFAFPLAPPILLVVVVLAAEPVGTDKVHPDDLAQSIFREHLLDEDVDRGCPHGKVGGKNGPRLFGNSQQGIGFAYGVGQGLFTHDMEPLAERRHGDLSVTGMGGRNCHNVAQSGVQKVAVVRKMGDPCFFFPFQVFGIDVTQSCDLKIFRLSFQVLQMVGTHDTGTDNTNSNRSHFFYFLDIIDL